MSDSDNGFKRRFDPWELMVDTISCWWGHRIVQAILIPLPLNGSMFLISIFYSTSVFLINVTLFFLSSFRFTEKNWVKSIEFPYIPSFFYCCFNFFSQYPLLLVPAHLNRLIFNVFISVSELACYWQPKWGFIDPPSRWYIFSCSRLGHLVKNLIELCTLFIGQSISGCDEISGSHRKREH